MRGSPLGQITQVYRSEEFALTGYVVPGCVEDGTWMLWGNSSVVDVAVVAAVVLALSAILGPVHCTG